MCLIGESGFHFQNGHVVVVKVSYCFTLFSRFALGEQGPPSCRILVKFSLHSYCSLLWLRVGLPFLWLERALAGLLSPLLEIN